MLAEKKQQKTFFIYFDDMEICDSKIYLQYT